MRWWHSVPPGNEEKCLPLRTKHGHICSMQYNQFQMEWWCDHGGKLLYNQKKSMEQKILSVCDEAYILLCLINYEKRWFAEVLKAKKKVRKVILLVSHHNTQCWEQKKSLNFHLWPEWGNMDRQWWNKPTGKPVWIWSDTLYARLEHLTNTFLPHFTDYTLYILLEQVGSW